MLLVKSVTSYSLLTILEIECWAPLSDSCQLYTCHPLFFLIDTPYLTQIKFPNEN